MVNVELAIYIEIYLRESLTIIQERERERKITASDKRRRRRRAQHRAI